MAHWLEAMMASEPRPDALGELFTLGHARVPVGWALDAPERCGLWWRPDTRTVVATPALLRLGATLPSEGERVGAVLATVPRFRSPWLRLQAARLRDLGDQDALDGLLETITALGLASGEVRAALPTASRESSEHTAVELAVFGAPADQPAAAPGLMRVLGATGGLVGQQRPSSVAPLVSVAPDAVDAAWCPERLLQAPHIDDQPPAGLLPGAVPAPGRDALDWVLHTPWATLLAVLVYTMEAWAAERVGGLALELDRAHVQHFRRPPQVRAVVTLPDGREVDCGTLGELCLHAVDALGMAVVPVTTADQLDRALGPVIESLLAAGVWRWHPASRSRYVIDPSFSRLLYGGRGHRSVYLGAERLYTTLRETAVAWARSTADRAAEGGMP